MGSRDVLVGRLMKAAASVAEVICIVKLNEHQKEEGSKNKESLFFLL